MEDTISRKMAIDAHYEYCNKHPDAEFPVWSLKILEDVPSAQPERRWIPCSERLPEGKQEVLVTEYGDTDMGRRFDGRWVDRYGDKMKDVTAWMPKPEPYKEGGAV